MRAFLQLCFFFIISNSIYAQFQTLPLVTTEGRATLKVKPDYAIIGFKVYREIKLNAAGDPLGFEIFKTEDTKIKLFDFEDKNMSDGLIKLEGAAYVKEVFITVTDLTKLDKILLELNRLGYKKYHYFEFRLRDLVGVKSQAKVKAINAARAEAALLAKELGQLIGKAHAIDGVEYEVDNWYDSGGVPSFKKYNDDYVIEPGYISVTAKVRVSFDLVK